MRIIESNNRYFGNFGGMYVPEMLMPALKELDRNFREYCFDKIFLNQLKYLQKDYIGRPSTLYGAFNFSRELKEKHGAPAGTQVYLKLESNNHTGAHKINNVVGQVLLAQRMNKKHIIAETGAGQHGLATAAACARFNIKCTIFMGETDIQRQYPNVFSMRQMGAEVVSVSEGSKTLKDAVNAALKYWVEHLDDTYYLLGSALGPHPYPEIVQYFQSVIGEEAKAQIMELEQRLPDYIFACVGGGSNALGMFTEFLADEEVQLVGVEAGGKGIETGAHATRFCKNGASIGIAQGYKSYFLQTEDGQLADTHSISAGLDYAGISPQLAELYESKRIQFESATDDMALEGYKMLARTEGMLPALESSHALGKLIEMAPRLSPEAIVIVNVSGRGDKDLFIVASQIDGESWASFLKGELQRCERKLLDAKQI